MSESIVATIDDPPVRTLVLRLRRGAGEVTAAVTHPADPVIYDHQSLRSALERMVTPNSAFDRSAKQLCCLVLSSLCSSASTLTLGERIISTIGPRSTAASWRPVLGG